MTMTAADTCSMEDVCEPGFVDFLVGMQEMVVLGLAFLLGWLLFRPVLSLLLGVPVRRAASTGEQRIPLGLNKLKLSGEAQSQDLSLTKADDDSSPKVATSNKARERSVPSISLFNEDFGLGSPGKSEVSSHCLEDMKRQACFNETVNDESSPGNLDVPGQLYHLALARERARRQDIKGAGNCIEAVRSRRLLSASSDGRFRPGRAKLRSADPWPLQPGLRARGSSILQFDVAVGFPARRVSRGCPLGMLCGPRPAGARRARDLRHGGLPSPPLEHDPGRQPEALLREGRARPSPGGLSGDARKLRLCAQCLRARGFDLDVPQPWGVGVCAPGL